MTAVNVKERSFVQRRTTRHAGDIEVQWQPNSSYLDISGGELGSLVVPCEWLVDLAAVIAEAADALKNNGGVS